MKLDTSYNVIRDLGELVVIEAAFITPQSRTPKEREIKRILKGMQGLQEKVFSEQGVSFEDYGISYHDAVGEIKDLGALDGSQPNYRLLLLVKKKEDGTSELIGMRATEAPINIKGFGNIEMDYLAALVPNEEASKRYVVNLMSLFPSPMIQEKMPLSFHPASVLDQYDGHLNSRVMRGLVARFTDGIGVGMEQFASNNYLESPVEICVPPMGADTLDKYMKTLSNPVHLKGRFYKGEKRLTEEQATELMLVKYLVEGYIELNYRTAKEIGLTAVPTAKEFKELGWKAYVPLPCITETLDSIRQVAAANKGYIPFHPIK